MSLILASTSRYRKALLARLGVPFRCEAPATDEAQWRHLAPREQACFLAQHKAESLAPAARARGEEQALIIGSDQVVDFGGQVLEKPGTVAAAEQQLRRLSGRSHRLLTAVAVHHVGSGRSELAVDVHTLTMRALSDVQIQRYVAQDQPLDCAGSYALERRGVALFARIEADPDTADDSAVVGLPLMKLCDLLRRFGYEVLEQPARR